ncbi:uncharacterized protein DS421_3g89690 [Arachis hypogaea]|nr:uncharacterized protein DS421_3g89690 [Arachis hypogaea]
MQRRWWCKAREESVIHRAIILKGNALATQTAHPFAMVRASQVANAVASVNAAFALEIVDPKTHSCPLLFSALLLSPFLCK